MLQRNQPMQFQQGLPQPQLQPLLLQQAIAKQQQFDPQFLLALAAQQSDAVLQKALDNPNAAVRRAAAEELDRRTPPGRI